MGWSNVLLAQIVPDSLINNELDSLRPALDTLANNLDTSSAIQFLNSLANDDLGKVKLSKDSLDAPVTYLARDSMIYDIKNEKIYLYGEASVQYQSVNLKADFIILDWKSNIVSAEGLPDAQGNLTGFPQFKEGEQEFTSKKMRYNFETRKGIIFDVSSTYNDLYVLGERSKFVSADPADTTSRDIIYSQGAIFTTCSHSQPHFGIRSNRQKVIPNELVIVGPSNLEIMGIPTPLWLPFGFFPITKSSKSGILFPQDYEYSEQWGFGLRDLGYYIPINERMDLSIQGDIYLKGTWGLRATTNFNRRYKYSGNVTLGYARQRVENGEGVINFNPSYFIRTNINQDSRAHPAIKFGGSVNIQANNYLSRNQNDAQSVLRNQLSSNLNFSHSFPNKPYSLSISLNHSQNTQTRQMTINFPNINFQMQTIYPFKSKKPGKEQWYERIALQYRGEAKNRFETTDSTLFTRQTLEDAQFGAKHRASLNTSLKVLKYFNLNPNVSYEETWNFKSIQRTYDPDLNITQDTIFNADSTDFAVVADTNFVSLINTDTLTGFRAVRQFTASMSMNTTIFGTLRFKKGAIRGIRHVVKPSISFNFTPDYTNPSFNYFDRVRDDFYDEDSFQEYSLFEGGVYGQPSSGGKQMSLSYSITNIFEAKYYSKRDSTDKKFKLFDNIYVNGNYNFARDSLKFSPVSLRGTARFFKGISTLAMSAQYDPYAAIYKENSLTPTRVDRFYWRTNGQFLRFVNANARLGTRLTVKKIREFFKKKKPEVEEVGSDVPSEEEFEEEEEDLFTKDPNRPSRSTFPDTLDDPEGKNLRDQPENILDLIDNFSINHNIVFDLDRISEGRDTFQVTTNSLSLVGRIKLTRNWGITVGNFGYDFVRKSTTYPDFGLTRDLHCWQMSFRWQPRRNVYQFTLQVKPGSLGFLRIPYNRNVGDGRFGGF